MYPASEQCPQQGAPAQAFSAARPATEACIQPDRPSSSEQCSQQSASAQACSPARLDTGEFTQRLKDDDVICDAARIQRTRRDHTNMAAGCDSLAELPPSIQALWAEVDRLREERKWQDGAYELARLWWYIPICPDRPDGSPLWIQVLMIIYAHATLSCRHPVAKVPTVGTNACMHTAEYV